MIKITEAQYAVLRRSINGVHLHVNLARDCYKEFLERVEKSGHTSQAWDSICQFASAIGRAEAALSPFEPIEVDLENLADDSRNLFSEIAASHEAAKTAVATWAASDVCDNRLAEAVGVEAELGWASRQAEEIYRFAAKA